ncbi:MAG: tRNA (adenosine(37)-N6)-dimethylallyltransferase MiaA [Planctomycetota bacterium]
MSGEKQRIVVLVGATASGKARLALEAAREAGAEILSCDSMKVYREMNVGTAKPDAASRAAVPWHALDLVAPHERFDASMWAALAEDVLARARARGVPVLVSGGTVLYMKALTEGLFEGAPRDPAVRARIRAEAEALGLPALHARLVALDPVAGARIHPNDLRRVERALEVHALTGKPISALQEQFGHVRAGVERTVFTVAHRRGELDHRINRRIDRMIADGWLDETRRLAGRPLGVSREAEQAIGYRELLAHVRGGETDELDLVVEKIKTNTRRFARRQLNWLRHHVEGLRLLDVPPGGEPVELHKAEVVRALVQSVS